MERSEKWPNPFKSRLLCRLGGDWQKQSRFEHEWKLVDYLDRAHGRAFIDRFQGDNEREPRFVHMWFLDYRIDVDAFVGDGLGHFGQNSRPVSYGKPNVPAQRPRLF